MFDLPIILLTYMLEWWNGTETGHSVYELLVYMLLGVVFIEAKGSYAGESSTGEGNSNK